MCPVDGIGSGLWFGLVLLVGLFLMIDSGHVPWWFLLVGFGLWVGVVVVLSGFVVRFEVFCSFSMESLILAQDERWRRA